jgi:RNA polymerase sigma factor (sigma-70 family)
MLTDTNLVEAARGGDAEAIDVLLLHYQPMIAGFARRYCATPEDVEDAVQETLWIAAQKIGTLRVAAAFTSWAFQVVRRTCYRLLNIKRKEVEFADTSFCVVPEDDEAAHIHLRQDIAEALAELPYDYRVVILLCDIEERTAPETAATLNISVAAVKARLHRARKLLRQSLAQWQA